MTRGARGLIIVFAILGTVLAGVAVVYLPPLWSTVVFGLGALVFMLARPRKGLFLLLASLYFPLFPVVPVGPLEASGSSFMALGLFVGTLNLQRRHISHRLARWQSVLLASLGIAFLLAVLFSESVADSLVGVPNLVVYWIVLYVFMALVRTREQLWAFARCILGLAFILSIWRVELRPLRILLGLPSLGVNGAVFAAHPAFATSIVVATMLPVETISRPTRALAWLALLSFAYHGLLYQTRAGWLAWVVMVLALGLRARGRIRVAFVIVGACILLLSLSLFADAIQRNVAQTQMTVRAALGEISYESGSSDDVIRLVARDAGLRMFYARPILGWGPNAFLRLKPSFLTYFGKEADAPGAFNAWLIALTEWGVVGTAVAVAVFLMPLPLIWRAARGTQDTATILALGFAAGVLGLSVHLLFIDLMYSFAWAHAGLALAAARLAIEQSHA